MYINDMLILLVITISGNILFWLFNWSRDTIFPQLHVLPFLFQFNYFHFSRRIHFVLGFIAMEIKISLERQELHSQKSMYFWNCFEILNSNLISILEKEISKTFTVFYILIANSCKLVKNSVKVMAFYVRNFHLIIFL